MLLFPNSRPVNHRSINMSKLIAMFPNIAVRPNKELLKCMKDKKANAISLVDDNDVISEFYLFSNAEFAGSFNINTYSPESGFYNTTSKWVEDV